MIIRAVLAVFGFEVDSWVKDVLANLAIFALTLLVVQLVQVVSMRDWLVILREIESASKDRQKPFFEKLATARLVEIRDTIRKLTTGEFKPEQAEAMSEYFRSFFNDGGGGYVGVDSHLPTDFIDRYDWYLKVHEAAIQLDQPARGPGDIRILVATRNDLTDDYLRSAGGPRKYLDFVRWHKRNGVELRWVDPKRVLQLRRRFDIGDNVDIAIWAKFAVAFINDETGVPSLTMRFPTDEDTPLSWTNCTAFVHAVEEISEPLEEGPPGLEVVDEDLAKAWEAYVDSTLRMSGSGPFGTFLLETVAGSRLILDAAAGIGCESVLLLQRGYAVISNEVDANLASVAERFARERNVKLDIRNYLWEELASNMTGGFQFDRVLCLGNSLCLVDSAERRADCLRNFFKVLAPGGQLIIDERNYTYMLEHRARILSDPTSFPPFRGDVMYSGNAVRGTPVEISEKHILWRLFNCRDVSSMDDVRSNLRGRGALVLYPFKYGELYDALTGAGFVVRRVYADLVSVDASAGMPDYSTVSNRNFFTYVAERPR